MGLSRLGRQHRSGRAIRRKCSWWCRQSTWLRMCACDPPFTLNTHTTALKHAQQTHTRARAYTNLHAHVEGDGGMHMCKLRMYHCTDTYNARGYAHCHLSCNVILQLLAARTSSCSKLSLSCPVLGLRRFRRRVKTPQRIGKGLKHQVHPREATWQAVMLLGWVEICKLQEVSSVFRLVQCNSESINYEGFL